MKLQNKIFLLFLTSVSFLLLSCQKADGLYDSNIQDFPADQSIVSWIDGYCGDMLQFHNAMGDTICFSIIKKEVSYLVGKNRTDISTYDYWDVRTSSNYVTQDAVAPDSIAPDSIAPDTIVRPNSPGYFSVSYSDELSLIDLALGIIHIFKKPRKTTEYLIRKEFVRFSCEAPNSEFPPLNLICPGEKGVLDMRLGELNVSFELGAVKDSIGSKVLKFYAPVKFGAKANHYEPQFETLYYSSYGSRRSICLKTPNSSSAIEAVWFNILGIGAFKKNGVIWMRVI